MAGVDPTGVPVDCSAVVPTWFAPALAVGKARFAACTGPMYPCGG